MSDRREVSDAPLYFGSALPAERLFVIAGPCVIESREMLLEIAGELATVGRDLEIDIVFKASYEKANRTSVNSFTGLGREEGLRLLSEVRNETGLRILSDVHTPEEVAAAGEVLDVLQIPAFLSRQTELLQRAAHTGKIVNVKKGQFLAPDDMHSVVEKVRRAQSGVEVWVTERGTTFGHHDLVVDMRGFTEMRATGATVVYDVTHSLQHPGKGGDRRFALPLARAALGAGAHGLFIETHPDPDRAMSDATTQLPLASMRPLLEELREWRALQAKWERPDPVKAHGG
ncbi:MAG: 3-deoxy-8-phosphooctulonate synthase [Candidatus Eisenbacteria bacterium]